LIQYTDVGFFFTLWSLQSSG